MRSFLALFSLAAVAVVGVSVLASSGGAASAQSPVTVTMGPSTGPAGGGDQSGTATLTAMGNQTQVVLNIDASPGGSTVEQPVHIHAGTCSSLGAVAYPLTNVVDGASTTVVDAALESLQTGDFSINAHKSGEEIGVYVSCGDIPTAAATPGVVPSSGGRPVTDDGVISLSFMLVVAGALAIIGGSAVILAARRAH